MRLRKTGPARRFSRRSVLLAVACTALGAVGTGCKAPVQEAAPPVRPRWLLRTLWPNGPRAG